MLKRGLGHTLFVLALLTIFAASAAADSRARIVRLSFVEGNVQMDQRDGRGLQKAFLNMPIGQGTILLTRDEGRAEIEFENGSTIRLARDSQLEFQQLGLRTEGAKFSVIDVSEGTLYFDIKKKNEDEFVVTVNGQQITAPKSARFRLRAGKDGANVSVFKGEVELDSAGKAVEVRKGESIELDRSDATRYFLSREITTDPLDAWDLEREKYRDQYFAASTYSYNPAYSYGYADLAYWGSYTVVPVYGRVWRPYFVGLSWQPFADGSWVWYPGAGYVWVSAYPWGWAPYRYGSWVYAGRNGWCWRPGRSYVSWVTVPVVYNAPVAFIHPRPPIDRRHHEPIFVGNGGHGPVHPGDGGRGHWYRDDDPVRGGGGGNGHGGKKEVFNGPDVRPMPHDNPGHGGGGKKEVFNGPDVRPMPHDDPSKGNDVVGKKDGFNGPDVHPGKRDDLDAREQQGGKKQVFTGPDVRPMPHDNAGNGNDQGAKRETFNGPDVRPGKRDDLDAREEQSGGKKQVFGGPDVRPMPHENPAGDSGGKREAYNGPDVRPTPHGPVVNDNGSPANRGYGGGSSAGPASSGGSAPVHVAPSGGGRSGGYGGGPSSGGSAPSGSVSGGSSGGMGGGPSSGMGGGSSSGMGSGGGHSSAGPSSSGGGVSGGSGGQRSSGGGAATRSASQGAGSAHKH
jgi:hypothetical protein